MELCRKALAHQRARDLSETASALLAKDKQIAALQRECRELQARLTLVGKVRGPGHPFLVSPTPGPPAWLVGCGRDVDEMQMKREGGSCWGVGSPGNGPGGSGEKEPELKGVEPGVPDLGISVFQASGCMPAGLAVCIHTYLTVV